MPVKTKSKKSKRKVEQEFDLLACEYSVPVMRSSIFLSPSDSLRSQKAFYEQLQKSFPKIKKLKKDEAKQDEDEVLLGFRPAEGHYSSDEKTFLWLQHIDQHKHIHLQSEPKTFDRSRFSKLFGNVFEAMSANFKTTIKDVNREYIYIRHRIMHRFHFPEYQPGQEFTEFSKLFSCFPKTPKVIKHEYFYNSKIRLMYVNPMEFTEINIRGPYQESAYEGGIVDIELIKNEVVMGFDRFKETSDGLFDHLQSVVDELMTDELRRLIELASKKKR